MYKKSEQVQLTKYYYTHNFLLLYSLFLLSEQDRGASVPSLDSGTKRQSPMILCVEPIHVINLIALIAVTTYRSVMFCSNYTHYITIISIIFTIILIISKLEIAIGCVFNAENVPNGTSTTGDQ